MENPYIAGWCPFCSQGHVVFIKITSSDESFLLCRECETIWASPEGYLDKVAEGNYQFTVYGKAIPLTREEITEKG